MTANAIMPNIKIYTNNTFSIKELAFISAYMSNGFNATQAVIDAGYNNKNPGYYAQIKSAKPPGERRKIKWQHHI